MTDTDAIRALREQVEADRKSALADEVESLIAAIYGGVRVTPHAMIDQTTILVRPVVWEALKARIEADTAQARALEAEGGDA